MEAAAEEAPYDGLQQKEGGEVVEGRDEGGGLRSASALFEVDIAVATLTSAHLITGAA